MILAGQRLRPGVVGVPVRVLSYPSSMLVHVSSFVELPVDLDGMAPGPELGAILAALDLSRYNGFQLVEILSAQQRQVSFENARLLAVTRELTYTSWGGSTADPTRRVEPDRFTGTEIAFALSVTEYSAGAMIVTALTAVDELPALHQALKAGRIDLTKTRMIVNELVGASREHARLVVDKVLTHAHRATTTQLKAILRRALLSLDPDAVKKRHQASVQSRRFDHDPDPCGTASLTASYLPPDKAAAAYDYVDAVARASKAAGDPRTLHQIRADVCADLLAGVDPTLAGAATPAARKGAISIHLGLGTLAMLDDNPGELPGYGPVIADVARQTAAQLADHRHLALPGPGPPRHHHGRRHSRPGRPQDHHRPGRPHRVPAHRRPGSLRQGAGPDLPGPGMCQTSAPVRHRPHLRLDLLPGRLHLEHVCPL